MVTGVGKDAGEEDSGDNEEFHGETSWKKRILIHKEDKSEPFLIIEKFKLGDESNPLLSKALKSEMNC